MEKEWKSSTRHQLKKKRILVLLIVLGLLLITMGTSAAFYTYIKKGNTENTLTAGHLSFRYDELNEQENNSIAITNALPMSDEEGKNQSDTGYFEFQIRATTLGSPINYEIYLTKNTSTLPERAVKTYLSTLPELEGDISTETPVLNTGTKKDINKYSKLWISQVPPVKSQGNGRTLYQETIPINQENYEKNYRFRMWLSEDANQVDENGRWIYSNMSFSVNVNVFATNDPLPAPVIQFLDSQTNWYNGRIVEESQVTKIEFVQNNIKPQGIVYEWSPSPYGQTSYIMAYLTKNDDGENTYTVTVDSNQTIYFSPNSSFMFSNFSNLKEIKGLELLDTSEVISMSNMFGNCSQLIDVGDLSGWDTSNVTDMSSMFGNCSQLTDLSSIKNWDTSNVTDMHWMFINCNTLNNLNLSGWNTSSVARMRGMFRNCSQLTKLNIGNFDFSSIKVSDTIWGCSEMFDNTTSLTAVYVNEKGKDFLSTHNVGLTGRENLLQVKE